MPRTLVVATSSTSTVLLTVDGLAPRGEPTPEPGMTLRRGGVRVLALPNQSGGTGALVVGLDGRTLLWAPVAGRTHGRDGEPLAATAYQALAGADLDGLVLDLDMPGGAAAVAADLARLRRAGAPSPGCDVVAIGEGRGDGPDPALAARLARWGVRRAADREPVAEGGPVAATPPRRTLVLGPAASGKSALAEDLLLPEAEVVYLATGPAPTADDTDWADRVRRHRLRRPPNWQTEESGDADLLRRPGPPLLFDSVGGWVTATLQDCGAWSDTAGWQLRWEREVATLVEAWRAGLRRVVAVSEEAGWGVVPATASGRLYRDCLGLVNQQLARHAEQCLLVVAGRVVRLDGH